MRNHISSVTVKDLTTYFKGTFGDGRDRWDTKVSDGGVTATCDTYTVKIKPESIMYKVKIGDVENPSDSDEGTTDKPVDFIVDFMGTGTLGDEYFKDRLSFTPDALRALLVRVSKGVDDGSIGPRRLASILRRAMVLVDVVTVRRLFTAALKFANDHDVVELAKLRSDMDKKGWRVKVDEDADGFPFLTVNIGDMFEAKITVDSQLWSHYFEVNGSDAVDKGVGEDPIAAFQEFYKTEEVREAKREQRGDSDEDSDLEFDWDSDMKVVDPQGATRPARKPQPSA